MKTTTLVVCLLALAIAVGLVVTGLAQGEHPAPLAVPLVESPRYRIVEAAYTFEGFQTPVRHVFLLDSETGRVWQFREIAPSNDRPVFVGWDRCYVEGIQEEGRIASHMVKPTPSP